jgi:hypothetical protein
MIKEMNPKETSRKIKNKPIEYWEQLNKFYPILLNTY